MKARERHLNIVRSSWEQTRCPFGDSYTVGKGKKPEVWTITNTTETLATGDFTLAGHGGRAGEVRGITVETKWGGLNECAGNFTADRKRLEREFLRMVPFSRRHFIINDPDTEAAFMSIRSKVDREALRNSLYGWGARYGVSVQFTRSRLDMIEQLFFALRHYAEEPFKFAARRRTGKLEPVAIDSGHLADIYGSIGAVARGVEFLMAAQDFDADGDQFEPWIPDPAEENDQRIFNTDPKEPAP